MGGWGGGSGRETAAQAAWETPILRLSSVAPARSYGPQTGLRTREPGVSLRKRMGFVWRARGVRVRARARGGVLLLGTINMFVALSHYLKLKLYRALVVGEGGETERQWGAKAARVNASAV